jgi:hypothetical protein
MPHNKTTVHFTNEVSTCLAEQTQASDGQEFVGGTIVILIVRLRLILILILIVILILILILILRTRTARLALHVIDCTS